MLGNKESMAKNITRLMDERGLTRNDMCEALGVKYTTFVDWIKAVSYPRIDKIEMMANFFGVQKKDLVEEYAGLPSQDEALLVTFHNLNDEGKAEAERYMKYLVSQENYRKGK